ncbi:MAG TPA: Lrp/AsnC family transcriptional regulator [Candidatus Nanoarchaeia archaeon]|nr:Lrp/AsnC family transcriptional regulator [Candidatus Nanoarchaeia archaeon]
MKLDKKDFDIIAQLKEDSSQSTKDIAKNINLPITTIHNRINKLRNNGIIKRYTIELNYHKIGTSLAAYILLKLDFKKLFKTFASQEQFTKEIRKNAHIRNISFTTGAYDAIAFARFKDMEDLNNFLNYLGQYNIIKETITHIVLRED